MTLTPEQLALITAFRQETEDLFKALAKQIYFKNGVAPYTDTADVLATIPIGDRIPYITLVNVAGVDYWFTDSTTLVPYVGSLSLSDGSVTLVKMANMATASFIGRNSSGSGSPEILSVATVLSILGLTNVISDLANKVDKETGKALVLLTEIAKIHTSGSDNQTLTIGGTTAPTIALSGSNTATFSAVGDVSLNQSAGTITISVGNSSRPPLHLKSGGVTGDVATRLSGLVEGTDYPTGWTLSVGVNATDLIITHGLGRELASIHVWAKDTVTSEDQEMKGDLGYVALYRASDKNSFRIDSLAGNPKELYIYPIFY